MRRKKRSTRRGPCFFVDFFKLLVLAVLERCTKSIFFSFLFHARKADSGLHRKLPFGSISLYCAGWCMLLWFVLLLFVLGTRANVETVHFVIPSYRHQTGADIAVIGGGS